MKNSYVINSKELFEDIRNGIPEAYGFVFKTYYPRLKSYASRFISSSDDLNDVLQDCFVKLWENRQNLKNVSLSSLLFTMVRNSCLNYLRHKLVANECSFDELPAVTGNEQLYHLTFLNNPEAELLYAELKKEIDEVLQSLPDQTRRIFKMSRTEGMKNCEIAETLEISIKTVEYHITKVLKTLNAFMEKHGRNPLIVLLVYDFLIRL